MTDFFRFSPIHRTLLGLVLTLTVHSEPTLTDADYRVQKMRYGKNGKDKDLYSGPKFLDSQLSYDQTH